MCARFLFPQPNMSATRPLLPLSPERCGSRRAARAAPHTARCNCRRPHARLTFLLTCVNTRWLQLGSSIPRRDGARTLLVKSCLLSESSQHRIFLPVTGLRLPSTSTSWREVTAILPVLMTDANGPSAAPIS